MEREEDDYEDIVNEEKESRSDCGSKYASSFFPDSSHI